MATAEELKGVDCDADALEGVRAALRARLTEMCDLRETELSATRFVHPMFVQLGEGRTPIESMPGIALLSISQAV